jgi:hypothetical protein
MGVPYLNTHAILSYDEACIWYSSIYKRRVGIHYPFILGIADFVERRRSLSIKIRVVQGIHIEGTAYVTEANKISLCRKVWNVLENIYSQ